MKIKLVVIGKTKEAYLETGIREYEKRLRRYWPFEYTLLPDVKGGGKMDALALKKAEGELLLKTIQPTDNLILLDENGKEMPSEAFAKWFQKKANTGLKQLVLVVGGAYGFSDEVYEKAQGKLALSQMTFSHQMVRLFAIEQVYRAMTILHGEPYHHV